MPRTSSVFRMYTCKWKKESFFHDYALKGLKWTWPLFAVNTTSILNKVIKASVNNRFLHMLDYFCTYYFWSIETSILIIKLFGLIYGYKKNFLGKIVTIPSLCITIPFAFVPGKTVLNTKKNALVQLWQN